MERVSSQMQQALQDSQGLVRARYPGARSELAPSPDEPQGVHLVTIVDIDDPDEVMDLVLERVLHFQLEDGLPVHLIPIRPVERALEQIRLHSLEQRLRQRARGGGPAPEGLMRHQ